MTKEQKQNVLQLLQKHKILYLIPANIQEAPPAVQQPI